VLVPLFGLAGAAAAFTSMMALSTASLCWLLCRHERMRVDIFVAPGAGRALRAAARA
jgi:hypothetical protein